MRLLLACVVATLSGFIALSYEILWVRVYTFATESPPEAFGLLLAAYLIGLAVGALAAGQYCRRATSGHLRQLQVAGGVFVLANLLALLVIPGTARLVSTLGLGQNWFGISPHSTLPLFALAAAGLGVGFPLLSHFAIPADQHAGSRLSYLYVGNIIGSTLGSLATGLWLLDVMSLPHLNAALAIAGSLLGLALIFAASTTTRARVLTVTAGVVVTGLISWLSPFLHDSLYERLMYKRDFAPGLRFAKTIEGRSGVVNLTWDGVVYGGGSYDGQTNISPMPQLDQNRVLRAYLVPAFHPHPEEILMIGLGAGSWLQVLANLDEVKHITVVEINPGYVEIQRHIPCLASALSNPKVEIIIDDGRRYLGRTTKKFDLIIQNTIVYWRAHAANLLSREYFALSRKHLKPEGMLYFNSTYSAAAQKTGASTFPYAMRYQNMILGSEHPSASTPRASSASSTPGPSTDIECCPLKRRRRNSISCGNGSGAKSRRGRLANPS